jgi:GT2 family glycosyltransferase
MEYLAEVIEGVKTTVPEDTQIVVCDDGSQKIAKLENMGIKSVEDICNDAGVVLIKGPNLGVAANKNRALWALQNCHYICILEDDLVPREKGWFEAYEKASQLAQCHHFCRIQDKEIPDTVPAFSQFMKNHGLNTIFASSPRGDLTFLTREVVKKVGAFNPRFRGAGYAHGEWSERVARAGLIGHPLKWIDIAQGKDKIEQIGDREGGRWEVDQGEIKKQLKKNSRILKELNDNPYIHYPLVLE